MLEGHFRGLLGLGCCCHSRVGGGYFVWQPLASLANTSKNFVVLAHTVPRHVVSAQRMKDFNKF